VPGSSPEYSAAEPAGPPWQDWGPWARSPTWRDGALTRIRELEELLRWLEIRHPDSSAKSTDEVIRSYLSSARLAVEQSDHVWSRLTGRHLEAVLTYIESAESLILRSAPQEYLVGQLPSLAAHVERNLSVSDPERIRVEQLYARMAQPTEHRPPLSREDMASLIAGAQTATREVSTSQLTVARYRSLLFSMTVLLTCVAAAFALLGFLSPQSLHLCFTPEQAGRVVVACPLDESAPLPSLEVALGDVIAETVGPADILAVELVGVAGAAVAAVFGLRQLRGGAGRYGLAVPLAVIKLATGSLTAVLGLLLLRGGFVPGLTDLDSSSQILAWAGIFGLAQELLTRLLDVQGQRVLEKAGREPAPFDETRKSEEAMLRQVSLAVPAVSPLLQETLVEAVLGPPTPPYDGFIAIEARLEQPGASNRRVASSNVSRTVDVWFQTSMPRADAHSAVRVKGFRWQDEPVSSKKPLTLRFEIRLHIPDHRDSPFVESVEVPTVGRSDLARFVVGADSTAPLSTWEGFVEVSHKGRLVQVIDFPSESV
jgi:hypothetical protein